MEGHMKLASIMLQQHFSGTKKIYIQITIHYYNDNNVHAHITVVNPQVLKCICMLI
jgi:hypothetical protein